MWVISATFVLPIISYVNCHAILTRNVHASSHVPVRFRFNLDGSMIQISGVTDRGKLRPPPFPHINNFVGKIGSVGKFAGSLSDVYVNLQSTVFT